MKYKAIALIGMLVVIMTACAPIDEGNEAEMIEKTEFDKLSQSYEELEKKNRTLEEKMNNLENENTDLVENNENLEEEIDALMLACSDYNQKKDLFIEVLSECFNPELSYVFLEKDKDSLIELLGNDYEKKAVGIEGSSNGYAYKEYGIILSVYKNSDNLIHAVFIDNDSEVFGTKVGMSLDEIIGVLGETEIMSIQTEGQEYWAFYEYDNFIIEYRALSEQNVISIAVVTKEHSRLNF